MEIPVMVSHYIRILIQILFFSENAPFDINNERNNSSVLGFSFIYLAHARAVTYISWRKTSKYMPKGSVSNMLITSSADKICRLWVQTVLPDDGLLNISHFNHSNLSNSKFRTHRQKHRFLQRIKHIKACFQLRKSTRDIESLTIPNANKNLKQDFLCISSPPSVLPSSHSVHDLHSCGFHNVGFLPSLHFHLTGTINSETDIPLVPSMKYVDGQNLNPDFVLHWMNNKEMFFNIQADGLIYELLNQKEAEKKGDVLNLSNTERASADKEQIENSNVDILNENKKTLSVSHSLDEMNNVNDITTDYTDKKIFNDADVNINSPDTVDAKIEALIRDWHSGPDLMFAIHPLDGSFLIWIVHWLDEHHTGSLRQAQISFSTRIPNAFSIGDAISVSSNISVFSTTTTPLSDMDNNHFSDYNYDYAQLASKDNGRCIPMVYMVTHHSNGTLNLWNLIFSDDSKFSQLLSVEHVTRISGHRFKINEIICHPFLPLLLTTSTHDVKRNVNTTDIDITKEILSQSELILWKIDTINPLSQSGCLKELARIDSCKGSDFSRLSWIPTAMQGNISNSLEDTPSAFFVACDEDRLCIYQAVTDANYLLAKIAATEQIKMRKSDLSLSSLSSTENIRLSPLKEDLKILSQQSTSKPGAILQLHVIEDDSFNTKNIKLLHVFHEKLLKTRYTTDNDQKNNSEQKYYITLLESDSTSTIHMWQLDISNKASVNIDSELGKCHIFQTTV